MSKGLINNWQVDGNSVANGVVADATGGTSLTINGAATTSLIGNWDDDTLLGGAGNDTLHGGQGTDSLIGGDGTDYLYGDYSDYLMSVTNFSTQDIPLFGDDRLEGGASNDILYGGYGTDHFIFDDSWGDDTILDFANDKDEKIDFTSHSTINSFDDLTIDYGAVNTVITTDDGSITLAGVTSDLTENDFLF